MVNAVRTKNRVVVSAHSRGTIKTDNAVERSFQILMRDPELDYEGQATERLEGTTGWQNLKESQRRKARNKEMSRLVSADMDRYIKLIYAGNAVEYPTKRMRVDLFANKYDPISFGVGSYKTGTKRNNAEVHRGQGKGHGFAKQYTKDVSSMIKGDIENYG
jgi:hypothetical protein